MEAAMFFRGFICGWIGMAAIVLVLFWGMTLRVTATEYGDGSSPAIGYEDC
jgi:hypothetical protein